MNRRRFIQLGAATLAGSRAGRAAAAGPEVSAPEYRTGNAHWQKAYDQALRVLAGNIRVLPRFDGPVLIEGAEYPGVWQECGPHEALIYRRFRPDAARNSHLTFFALQRPDGQLPANNKLSESGFGQIQMVVPIAATAWELAHATGDSELLERAYTACSRWDAWLLRYRNTRGTGLTEGFCTYDTGHDNSPRWAGMPNQCPAKDARQCPPVAGLPRLCPDLSATTFGARRALAAMARALGKPGEADRWEDAAETLRQAILTRLYVPEDAAFYDLDAQGHFVRVRSDVLSRLCGEQVLDQVTFDHLWERQLGNPAAFWTPYPLPSVAMNDPAYQEHLQRNSWAGPAQALTALRAGRWFDHYGRSAEFTRMLDSWCDALLQDGTFRQQMDPVTGEFAPDSKPGYSPAALVLVDYTWRLAGIEELSDPEDRGLRFNLRPGHPAAQESHFSLRTATSRTAAVDYIAGHTGERATVSLNGHPLATLAGGHAALFTSAGGRLLALLGIAPTAQTVRLQQHGYPVKTYTLRPNQRLSLAEG